MLLALNELCPILSLIVPPGIPNQISSGLPKIIVWFSLCFICIRKVDLAHFGKCANSASAMRWRQSVLNELWAILKGKYIRAEHICDKTTNRLSFWKFKCEAARP